MTWPVLPPTLERVLPAAVAALLKAELACAVARERPCWALDAVSWAASFALVAPEDAALAASEVVEAARRCTAIRVWRRASLATEGEDMAAVMMTGDDVVTVRAR